MDTLLSHAVLQGVWRWSHVETGHLRQEHRPDRDQQALLRRTEQARDEPLLQHAELRHVDHVRMERCECCLMHCRTDTSTVVLSLSEDLGDSTNLAGYRRESKILC